MVDDTPAKLSEELVYWLSHNLTFRLIHNLVNAELSV